jgi:hypothetical protein
MGGRRGLLVGAALSGFAARRARAAEVDLLLVLAVDASGSVTPDRFALQKQGYVDAFRSPRLHAAIASGPGGAVAVAMFQWTGPELQAEVAGWTRLGSAADAEGFAARIEAAPRHLYGGGTSISGAIDHGRRLLAEAPFAAVRRVIDVSGDGSNNRGREAGEARDDAVAAGATINGLPIMALEWNLDAHYRDEVIGGPGAFLIPVGTFEGFAAAVLRKLVTEIAGRSEVQFAQEGVDRRGDG